MSHSINTFNFKEMFNKNYSNFVRPTSPTEVNHTKTYQCNTSITGDEAQRIYLEEIREANTVQPSSSGHYVSYSETCRPTKHKFDRHVSEKDLFLAAQSNDVDTIKGGLSLCPDKLYITDDYGWSLLMIACQANSVDTVKELLKRGIDTTIRDKAGNSAQSLVIRNKNFVLADVLISHKRKQEQTKAKQQSKVRVKLKEFHCSVCNQVYPDEQEHLSSTIHNINASQDKKIPANYAIPRTNRGYQIMLKVGWDRDSGLGPEGAGNKYPIKAVQKKDRKGLGHVKKDKEPKQETARHKNRKSLVREYESSKNMEINFRRQFY